MIYLFIKVKKIGKLCKCSKFKVRYCFRRETFCRRYEKIQVNGEHCKISTVNQLHFGTDNILIKQLLERSWFIDQLNCYIYRNFTVKVLHQQKMTRKQNVLKNSQSISMGYSNCIETFVINNHALFKVVSILHSRYFITWVFLADFSVLTRPLKKKDIYI